ncbi:ESX secretion-associated protein EspG [Nocardia australiensis]|uniref:ESX secretion-associated protein EspG n=1 Tax=Nocardia australiensis TaxID=2887191 RepID=UPI001D15D2E3|nr:ESX secretion-associated protein EspG [Nocardia australiensis]
MSRTWKFSDLEFMAQWETLKQDYLPDPFVYTCRTWSNEDYVREKADALARVRRARDRSFDDALEAVAYPDIRIVAESWDECEPQRLDRLIRLHGVRQGERGYVVSELAGESFWHSGGFTVTECDAVDLAAAVVRALPEVAGGSRAEVVLSTRDEGAELDYFYGRSHVLESFDRSGADHSTSFLDLPTSRVGTIDVIQGRSRFGPRGITRHRLEWRDVRDDGRYVIDDRTPPVAVGADASRLIGTINSRVAAVIRAIKDEWV